MKPENIPNERIANAMDLMTMMVVDELKGKSSKTEDELIASFLNSPQGKMLYDDSTKLWATSPTEIAENFIATASATEHSDIHKTESVL